MWEECVVMSIVRGSLVVKVTDSWPRCHAFKPSTAEDRRVRGRYLLNLSKPTSSGWYGSLENGRGCQLRCRPCHLAMLQNDEVRHQKSFSS
ncbi:hypothetical protein TNCV_4630871 [Trichonephila clavipes]|nr:hypothetical protein TNCV_4630871 [Trichonephila clavipes]